MLKVDETENEVGIIDPSQQENHLTDQEFESLKISGNTLRALKDILKYKYEIND